MVATIYDLINHSTVPKQNGLFFYCKPLLVQLINITVNKVTFMVKDIMNPIIRNIKNSPINTTSLFQRCSLLYVKWQHTLLILIPYVTEYTTHINKNQYFYRTFFRFFVFKYYKIKKQKSIA